MTLWPLVVCTSRPEADRLVTILRTAGFTPTAQEPVDLEDGNPLNRKWLIAVPIAEHAPAAQAVKPHLESGASSRARGAATLTTTG